jgi:ferric-dicitrate binding protein FerR (iron transport regulator)
MKLKNQFNKAEQFAKYFIRKHTDENQEYEKEFLSSLSEADKALLKDATDPLSVAEKIQSYESIDTHDARRKLTQDIQNELRRRSIRKSFFGGLKLAAVFVSLIAVGFIVLNQLKNEPEQVVVTQTRQPGSQKATLVLSDGETIDLTKMSSDSPIEKDGVRIINKQESIEYLANSESTEEAEIKTNSLIVPKGGEWQLVLEDGTRVWVNADSRLTYPTRFSKNERIVELEGEVYFEVAKDKERPFIVKTTNTEIQVLGTSFNIKAYKNEDEVQTTLVEGKIALKQSSDNRTIIMDPGYQAIVPVNGGEIVYRKVNPSVYTAWKDKRFAFVDESLESIMNSLERWYNIEIQFSDDQTKQLRYSTHLQRYDLIQQILDKIEKTNKVYFSFESDKILVKAK